MAVTYDPNTDYQAEIIKAVEEGDFEKAARLEEQRNQKIADLNKNGTNKYGATQSNKYSQYLTGYQSLNNQIWGEGGSGYAGYQNQIETETAYQQQNGTGANPYTNAQMEELANEWGIDPDSLSQYSQHGGYVKDGSDGKLPGTGEEGWGYVPGQQRPVTEGTSGADEQFLSDGAYAMIQHCKDMYAQAATQEERDYWHAEAEKIRARAGYSGGTDGSMYIPLAQLGVTPVRPDERENYWKEPENSISTVPSGGSGMPPSGSVGGSTRPQGSGTTKPDTTPTPTPDTTPTPTPAPSTPQPDDSGLMDDLKALLDKWQTAATAQSDSRINVAVTQAVTQLQQALEDAKPQFKEQMEGIAWDERQAMDNSALYAELRGDRGGIGQSQYNAIQNTAAQNRLAVRQAQTKLATDTGRQIAALRAQGEFEKADAALAVTQQYLEKLVGLEQWAAEFGLDVSQFQAELTQWEKEYQLALQKLQFSQQQWAEELKLKEEQLASDTNRWQAELELKQQEQSSSQSRWQTEFDYGVEQDARKQLAQMGSALLAGGVMPSAEQLAAMGMTAEQATEYIMLQQLKEAGA